MKIPSVLAGVAGGYFVAAELSRRGHIASISLGNTRGIDIMPPTKRRHVRSRIQCKTNQLTRKIGAHDGNDWTRLSALHVFRFGY
jgi:hypothetical protein